MPTPIAPLTLVEDELGLSLTLPKVCDSPASDIEGVVEAFRHAIAGVYAVRILRAVEEAFCKDPAAPMFSLRWRLFEDCGEQHLAVEAMSAQGAPLDEADLPERVFEEASGVHTDPEVLEHLNDWVGSRVLTPAAVAEAGYRVVGPAWDRARAAVTAQKLTDALPPSHFRSTARRRV